LEVIMPPDQAAPLTPERIMQLAWAYAPPLVIGTAVRFKLFDALVNGPKSAQSVADEAHISVRGTRIILNALIAFDLLRKADDDRYELTPESSAFLVTSKPSFRGGIFKHIEKQLIPQWLELDNIVRTGKPTRSVNQQGPGSEFFEQFVEDIFPMSYAAAAALGDFLKLASAATLIRVLDLAAGSGVWGIALAQKSPHVRVTAVDWPGVIPVTRRIAQRFNLTDRFSYIEGDINTIDFGNGFDIATLGHILHSEGESRSRKLIKKTFAALKPGGTIVISEFLANDTRTGPPPALIFAVNMLVNTDEGDTFSFTEIAAWLRDAGFSDPRTLDAPAPSPLILATKPA
jgi:SAM-dependent methyltransferase